MPLYLTERVHEFDTQCNDMALFVYFDTVKNDNVSLETLLIKSLDASRVIPIHYRKNMSANGEWTEQEFSTVGQPILSSGFDAIRNRLRNNELVIFPVRSFSIVKASSSEYVSLFMDKKLKEITATNSSNKDLFSYYAV